MIVSSPRNEVPAQCAKSDTAAWSDSDNGVRVSKVVKLQSSKVKHEARIAVEMAASLLCCFDCTVQKCLCEVRWCRVSR